MLLSHYLPLISHVHLKDWNSEDDLTCPPSGTGCLCLEAIVERLYQSGYRGWYTIEDNNPKFCLKDAQISYDIFSKLLTDHKMTPDMTEYLYPRVKRVDPGEYSLSPVPADAQVLFGGGGLDAWTWKGKTEGKPGWTVNSDGSMSVSKETGDITTVDQYGSFHLHLEWRVPADITSVGQMKGNSGAFLQGVYEIQILESCENDTYVNGIAGSFYKQQTPLANPCRRPGQWNVFDIYFTAARINSLGQVVSNPRATVIFNGVMVQNDVELYGTTEYIGIPRPVNTNVGPISLQAHPSYDFPVSFKNIWIRPL